MPDIVDIATVCNNASNIGTSCIYVKESDNIIWLLTLIAFGIIFICTYIFYKEIVK